VSEREDYPFGRREPRIHLLTTARSLDPKELLKGPIGYRLWVRRDEVRNVAARHGLSNIRVFGSVARGTETEESDVDLLVDVSPGVGLIGLARAQGELAKLVEARIDLVPAGDLKTGVTDAAMSEAIPL